MVAMPTRRRMIGRHLQRISGGTLGPWGRRRAVLTAFLTYARYWVESFRLIDLSADEIGAGIDVVGREHIEEGRRRGNGVILALPHLGGWDFGGAWLGTVGHAPTVVVEVVEPPQLSAWFTALRAQLGMTVVPLGPRAGTAVLRALQDNQVVALVSDRDIGGGGVEVEFFGERTTIPGGPATLALRTGAALLPLAVYFEERSSHRAVIRPPMLVERQATMREDVARITQDLARELESLIRSAPEQWHLFQPNWPSDRDPCSELSRRRRGISRLARSGMMARRLASSLFGAVGPSREVPCPSRSSPSSPRSSSCSAPRAASAGRLPSWRPSGGRRS